MLYLMETLMSDQSTKKNILGEKTMCQGDSDSLAPEHSTGHAPRDNSQSLGQAVL